MSTTTKTPESTQEIFSPDFIESLKLLSQGETLASQVGLSREKLDALYTVAYKLYETDNYEEALTIFKVLAIYDSQEERNFLAMAACYRELGQYKQAIDSYSVASILSGLTNPEPIYYTALCLLKTGEMHDAIELLKTVAVLERPDHPSDKELVTNSKSLLEILTAPQADK